MPPSYVQAQRAPTPVSGQEPPQQPLSPFEVDNGRCFGGIRISAQHRVNQLAVLGLGMVQVGLQQRNPVQQVARLRTDLGNGSHQPGRSGELGNGNVEPGILGPERVRGSAVHFLKGGQQMSPCCRRQRSFGRQPGRS